MKKIVIVDTNFLVNNMGHIKEILDELNNKSIDVYIPNLVRDEFINIQLRKLAEVYSKLENLKKSNKIINLKYRSESDSIKIVEDSYNEIFEQNFKDKIISYKKEDMLDRVLKRNRYKNPPFNIDSGDSSDKGFKDSIILLTILDFVSVFEEDAEFYFITLDKGFTKFKKEIENEFLEKTNKNLIVLEGNDKNKLYKELNILEEEIENNKQEENIFSLSEVDIDEIRKKINEYMTTFIWTTTFDYYGNPQDEQRFKLNSYINNDNTEKFLNDIDNVIEKNIFRNDIGVNYFFQTPDVIFNSYYDIDVDTMKKISDLYKRVKDTKYKEAFITYISQRINENKVNNMFTTESDDDLPF